MLLRQIHWLFLLFIFVSFNIRYVRTTWPVLNSSTTIQILGLFPDTMGVPEPANFTAHCRAMFKSAVLVAQKYNITIEGQNIGWESVSTGAEPINALSSTCQATSISNTIGIIGPALSRESPIIADFGAKVGIPVISYAATDPDLSNRNIYPAFYRTAPSDNSAALAIVKLFHRFNWTSCIIIHQNDAYGSGGAKAVANTFIKNDMTIVDTLVFDITTLQMRDNLKNVLLTSSTRIVVVWAGALVTSSILQNALNADVLGPNFIWILSSNIPLNSFNITDYSKLIGMLTVEPTIATSVHAKINTTLLEAAYNIWREYEPDTFPCLEKVDYYALFTFDATWTLIQALQKLCSILKYDPFSCISFTNSSTCFNHQFLQSKLLLDIINNITFLGVSGLIQFSTNTTDRINSNYYFAQNSQMSTNGLSFVPVLNYSDLYNWQAYSGSNVIIWPNNSLTPPTGGAKLEGIKIRIGVIEADPFTMVKLVTDEYGRKIRKLTGYIPDLIELLQAKIKFIPIIQLLPPNQTYNSLAQAIENGDCDIIIGDITVTATRRQQVGFTASIFDNSLRIIMRKTPDISIDWFQFMKPFTSRLWILILFTTIGIGILIVLVEKQSNKKLKGKPIILSCFLTLWYSFGHLVGYGVEYHVRTSAGRLLTAALYILSLVLVASYTANLASELTILKSKNSITSIDDIKSGRIPLNRIGVRVNTAIEEFFLREISDGNRDFYPLQSGEDTYISLLKNLIDVGIYDTSSAEYAVNNVYCNLTIIGEGFDKSVYGIMTPKQWLYAQDLDVNILLLKELGELDILKRTWFQVRNCDVSLETSNAIGIESLSGLFIIVIIICSLALLLHVWPTSTMNKYFRFKSRNRRKLKVSKRKKHPPLSISIDRF